jgi:TDG/mug DNA glycosylase family protein
VPRPKDVVVERPKILFVGINPGLVSGTVGHHFAGPGNPFWQLLFASKLTPVELVAEQDHRLTEFGLALINLCQRPTKEANDLEKVELERGKKRLIAKARDMKPDVVALVGVTLYPVVCKEGRGHKLEMGPGPKPETIAGAPVFVVPNPSGLNVSYPTFDAKLVWFRKLADYVSEGRAKRT